MIGNELMLKIKVTLFILDYHTYYYIFQFFFKLFTK